MLVLTQKIGEVVCVGSNVRIQVTAIDRSRGEGKDSGKVHLGIEAPPGAKVLRAELVPGYVPPPEPEPAAAPAAGAT
jgi:carbon storage regulator CsrA